MKSTFVILGRRDVGDHGEALAACCFWIIPSTLIQDLARTTCPPSAAERALSRATVAASVPCTSIMSRASDGSSARSVVTVISSIAASSEAGVLPGELNGMLEALIPPSSSRSGSE